MKIGEKVHKFLTRWPVYKAIVKYGSFDTIPKEMVSNFLWSDISSMLLFLLFDLLYITKVFDCSIWKTLGFYWVVPALISLLITFLIYLLYLAGKKYSDKGIGESNAYIIAGSFLYSLSCFVPAFFFSELPASILFLLISVMAASFQKSEKWEIWTAAFTVLDAGVIFSGIIDVGKWKYEITNTPVTFITNIVIVLFLCMVIYTMFFMKTTETRKAVESEKRNKAQTAFFINMSHEIRTPINAILGLNELIERDSSEPSIVDYSRDIRYSGENLLYLINNVLDFSRIESGKMEIAQDTYDFAEMVKSVYVTVRARAENKGLQLILKNDPEIPKRLLGDQGRIRQILLNLVTNAIKYTEKGSVTLSFLQKETEEGKVEIIASVKDTGAGISEEDMEKLFAVFERIDEKKNRNIEGSGLGLPLTKQLVEMMDGNISVSSRIGEGSVFTVIIPQAIANNEPVGDILSLMGQNKEKRSTTPLFKAPRASILVTDDVAINLIVFCGLVEKTGVQVTTAINGFEALEKSETKKFDLIFMDHLMPELDGVETLAKLRAGESINKDTPVIILTANVVEGLREEYLKEGFADYLSKPIEGELLEETLLKFLPEELIEKNDCFSSSCISKTRS